MRKWIHIFECDEQILAQRDS